MPDAPLKPLKLLEPRKPAADRTCGICTLCCKAVPVEALRKPRDRWCPHCAKGKGCTIYPTRPDHGFLFSYPRYVIKGGDIVVEEGEVRQVTDGREFVVRPACDEAIENYIRPLFEKVYTLSFANYPVEMERLRHPEVVACDTR